MSALGEMVGAAEDIGKILEQERALVFDAFDEATAFSIGSAIRDKAVAGKLPIIVDIQLWDRPLFYAACPGSSAANANWARRKRNVVKMFGKSTYRMVLERKREDRIFPPGEGLDPADYVLAGGGFPVTVKGVGVIGVIAVSGLPERQDHEVIVATLCGHLGIDTATLSLAAV